VARPCYAVEGDHRFYHAVVGAHRCQAVGPSDLATAFTAMDATVTVAGAQGTRSLKVAELFRGPGQSVLRPEEVLTSVFVPEAARRRPAAFEKLAMFSGGFAVASAAVSAEVDRGVIRSAHVVLGAVAAAPYRASRTEKALVGVEVMDTRAVEAASLAWALDAHPLSGNAWKVDAACGLIRKAVRRLARD
jgi:CO/xanthine dehydrogenase FAD-binding subunit